MQELQGREKLAGLLVEMVPLNDSRNLVAAIRGLLARLRTPSHGAAIKTRMQGLCVLSCGGVSIQANAPTRRRQQSTPSPPALRLRNG
eukprot:m.580786 g.580786  ORF g.580786 m.580786 type:complete len:88 (+) comp57930_c0_seq10:1343-1606(+)